MASWCVFSYAAHVHCLLFLKWCTVVHHVLYYNVFWYFFHLNRCNLDFKIQALYKNISSSSGHSDLLAICTTILSFSSTSSRYFMAKMLMKLCFNLWALSSHYPYWSKSAWCYGNRSKHVTCFRYGLHHALYRLSLWNLKPYITRDPSSYIILIYFMICSFSVKLVTGEQWPSRRMMIEELWCTESPANPEYFLQNHLGRTAIYSTKKLVFRDGFISQGNIHDEHLYNARKLSRLLSPCCS